MCTTRSWKNIDFRGGPEFVALMATRSDNLLVRVQVPIYPKVPAHLIIERLMKQLNSMKDCKCSHEASCNIHKQKGE